jgi:hypothetical protein
MTDDILAKVRKILAKAEDPAATVEEAEIYTAKAAELIATYGIDRALLAQADPSSDVVGDRVVVLDPPYALDKASLLSAVAMPLRCRAVQRVRYVGDRKEISLHLFGYASDLARSEILFTSLLLQATTTLARTVAPRGESVAAYRRSWLAGFTAAVHRRLSEGEERASRSAQGRADQSTGRADAGGVSVALVLADRAVAVTRAVETEYPYLRKGQGRRLTGSGRGSGWAAGQNADLGGVRLGVQPRGRIAG